MAEAYKTVDDLEDRTKTKHKNRTVVLGSFAEKELEDDKTTKRKSEGMFEFSEKEETKFLKELN